MMASFEAEEKQRVLERCGAPERMPKGRDSCAVLRSAPPRAVPQHRDLFAPGRIPRWGASLPSEQIPPAFKACGPYRRAKTLDRFERPGAIRT